MKRGYVGKSIPLHWFQVHPPQVLPMEDLNDIWEDALAFTFASFPFFPVTQEIMCGECGDEFVGDSNGMVTEIKN